MRFPEGLGSIPGQGTKIPQTVQRGRRRRRRRRRGKSSSNRTIILALGLRKLQLWCSGALGGLHQSQMIQPTPRERERNAGKDAQRTHQPLALQRQSFLPELLPTGAECAFHRQLECKGLWLFSTAEQDRPLQTIRFFCCH